MTYSIYRSANAIHYIYNNISEDIYIYYINIITYALLYLIYISLIFNYL